MIVPTRKIGRKSLKAVLFLLLFTAFAQPAAADDDSAGSVIAARRQAWAERIRDRAELLSKSLVFVGDLLSTNEVGRLQVLFRDDSVFMLAPDSQAKITSYLYAGGGGSSCNLDVARGVTRLISGRITEEGGTVNIDTAEARIGIRGTDAYIEGTQSGTWVIIRQASSSKPTRVCPQGEAGGECVDIGQNQGIFISGAELRRLGSQEIRERLNSYNQLLNPGNPLQAGVVEAGGGPTGDLGLLADNNMPGTGPGGGITGSMPTNVNPSMDTNNLNASYSGSFGNVSGMGAYAGLDNSNTTASYSYTISNLVNNPTLGSVQVQANSTTGLNFALSGNGSLAQMDGEYGTYIDSSTPGVSVSASNSGFPNPIQDGWLSIPGTLEGGGNIQGGFEGPSSGDFLFLE